MNSYEAAVRNIFSTAGIEVNGTADHDIKVNNPDFYRIFLKDGRLGMGESYMDRMWDSANLTAMYEKLIVSSDLLAHRVKRTDILWALLMSKAAPKGSLGRSNEIAGAHYSLGNDLFEAFLDPYKQYSCAYWETGAKTIEEAQLAKMDMISRKLKLEPGMTVLDVGCGWGGLARYMAEKHGVRVVGVSVSEEQIRLGQAACKGHDIELRVQDYRDVPEKFDRIVSVGMFEHVGVKYHRPFFQKMRESMTDDGLFLLHTIGFHNSKFNHPWLDKYIFPGALPPSMKHVATAADELMQFEDVHNIGVNYAPTLLAWHKKFVENWPQLQDQYDDRFFRMWEYYLLHVVPGFRRRLTPVWQFVLSKNGLLGGYQRPPQTNISELRPATAVVRKRAEKKIPVMETM